MGVPVEFDADPRPEPTRQDLVPVWPRQVPSGAEYDASPRFQAPTTCRIEAIPTPLGLLKALRRHLALATILGLLLGSAAAVTAWMVVPASKYSTSTLLHVASQNPAIIGRGGGHQIDFNMYKQTSIELLKSPSILGKALADEKVRGLPLVIGQDDPVTWLQKELQVTFGGETMRIAMSGHTPVPLPFIVNAVRQAYLDLVPNRELNDRQVRLDTMKKFYDTFLNDLKSKRDLLRKYSEELGSTDAKTINLAQQYKMEERANAQQQHRQIQDELRNLEIERDARLRLQEEAAAGREVILAESVERFMDADPAVLQAADRADKIAAQHAEAVRLARKSSDVARTNLLKQKAQANAELKRIKAEARPRIEAQLRAEMEGASQATILNLNERIEILKDLEKRTSEQIASFVDESRAIGRGAYDVSDILERMKPLADTADRLGLEIQQEELEIKMAPPRYRVIDEATMPRLQDDKRPIITAAAGEAGLGVALLGVAFLEFRSRRVDSAEDLIDQLRLRVIGALPALPARRIQVAQDQAAEDRWRHLLVESIDTTRALLLHGHHGSSIRSLMITSAAAGEGKTSLACHLAASLDRAGRRTLLVDADLRRPSIHEVLDIIPEPGLAELLRGEATLDEVLQKAPAGDLWVIPAGHGDARATQALAHEKVRALFDAMKARFDFVIVDTSPILPVSDALMVGQHVDGAICAILRDVSRLPRVQEAYRRLVAMNVRVLGAVFAGISGTNYGSGYDYHGGYAYSGAFSQTGDTDRRSTAPEDGRGRRDATRTDEERRS